MALSCNREVHYRLMVAFLLVFLATLRVQVKLLNKHNRYGAYHKWRYNFYAQKKTVLKIRITRYKKDN